MFKQICLFLLVTCLWSSPQPKTALVCGGGGFIGHHLVKHYKELGYWVRAVDLKYPEFCSSYADEFLIADLRDPAEVRKAFDGVIFDYVFQLAADMGGMGYLKTHDAQIMYNSALINLNVLEECRKTGIGKVFFSSSACVYPEHNQMDPNNPKCSEDSAYPAAPDTEYGWEKLFSERLYLSYARDYGMDVRVVRFHNIFGPQGTWKGGREKAPAALSRKVAEAKDGDTIQVWGKGDQTRSFLYIDECIQGIQRVMEAPKGLPVLNLGSEEMISINDLVLLIARIANKKISIQNVPGPEGVRGRNSDNALILKQLNWQPSQNLETGLKTLYPWIQEQVMSANY